MADKKISALTGASTPLAGTEVLPIVQSGATVKVAVSDLTAGRAMSALSLTTATVQATNSGGLALKNSGGTTQLSLGAGGGDNVTLSVATNITPANAAVAISPTGTGTVTINPATASTMNNVAIGGSTPLAITGTTITATGAITPSQTSGIVGTTTNNNADAGVVGEYVSSTVATGSAVTINYGGSGVPVTSISLTAGDWDVGGWVGYNIAAGSVVTYLIQGISTSNTSITGETSNVFNQIASTGPQIPIPIQRVSIASTTTIYLSSATGGSGTALTAYGTIRARRIR
jgi:hypothetical protein